MRAERRSGRRPCTVRRGGDTEANGCTGKALPDVWGAGACPKSPGSQNPHQQLSPNTSCRPLRSALPVACVNSTGKASRFPVDPKASQP